MRKQSLALHHEHAVCWAVRAFQEGGRGVGAHEIVALGAGCGGGGLHVPIIGVVGVTSILPERLQWDDTRLEGGNRALSLGVCLVLRLWRCDRDRTEGAGGACGAALCHQARHYQQPRQRRYSP